MSALKNIYVDPSKISFGEPKTTRYNLAAALVPPQERTADFKTEEKLSREISARSGIVPNGTLIPLELVFPSCGKRANDLIVSTGDTPKAGYVVGTVTSLGNAAFPRENFPMSVGPTVIDNVKSDFELVRVTLGMVGEAVAPGTAASGGDLRFGRIALGPKRISQNIRGDRGLFLQSDIHPLILRDMAAGLRAEQGRQVLHGQGTTQGLGVEFTSGVTTIDGTDFNYTTALTAVETAITSAFQIDAQDAGWKWVTSKTDFVTMLSRVKFSGTDTTLIEWKDNAFRMAGYPVIPTNACEEGKLFFGNWKEAYIVLYALDIVSNPFTFSKSGHLEVTGDLYQDVALRVPECFVFVENVNATAGPGE